MPATAAASAGKPVIVTTDNFVRAETDLLAHRLPRIVRTIDQLHSMRHHHCRRVALQRIRTRDIQSPRRDLHPRAGCQPL